jgi:peroxiredoxin Q/BCP
MIENYLPVFNLHKGDMAPDFVSRLEDGSSIHLYEVKAKWIVLFFYPQDDTPTCTKEACNIRDNYDDLSKVGCEIFGISPDNEKQHDKFITKYKLPFRLIVDEDHSIAESYHVWSLKKFMGMIYTGIHRTTYILNDKKEIHEIIYPVESARHHEQILESIQNILPDKFAKS